MIAVSIMPHLRQVLSYFNKLVSSARLRKILSAQPFNELKKTDAIFILTGAGISKESGIETFRDEKGHWLSVDPNTVARKEAFESSPDRVILFHDKLKSDFSKPSVFPNAAHFALAELEKVLPESTNIVTQNIDDLHWRAGTRKLIQIHGNLFAIRCSACPFIEERWTPIGFPNRCINCDGENTLRPNVVFLKEAPFFMGEVSSMLRRTKLFVSIGTSGSVYPAADFVRRAKNNGATCIAINKWQMENADMFDCIIQDTATRGTAMFVKLLLELVSK